MENASRCHNKKCVGTRKQVGTESMAPVDAEKNLSPKRCLLKARAPHTGVAAVWKCTHRLYSRRSGTALPFDELAPSQQKQDSQKRGAVDLDL